MLNQVTTSKYNCTIAFDTDEQRYLFVSDSFCNVFGVDAHHLQQNTGFLNGIVTAETRDQIRELTGTLTNGRSIQLNYHLTTNNRHLTETRRLITDTISGHKILISDIAECPVPEQETDESRHAQFLNSLIDSQTNFLIRINTQGNFTFVNKQFTKTFGYS